MPSIIRTSLLNICCVLLGVLGVLSTLEQGSVKALYEPAKYEIMYVYLFLYVFMFPSSGKLISYDQDCLIYFQSLT